jgi:large subunit ribosomal protein L11
VIITVYQDKSFTFITKTPPAPILIKKAANLASGSKTPGRESAGKITRLQIREIAKTKMQDLNARTEAAAMRIIEGTARSMGIEVIDA